jgi:hypothetical protein
MCALPLKRLKISMLHCKNYTLSNFFFVGGGCPFRRICLGKLGQKREKNNRVNCKLMVLKNVRITSFKYINRDNDDYSCFNLAKVKKKHPFHPNIWF